MGYYIQGPTIGKAVYIANTYDGEIVTEDEARAQVGKKGVIVVVSNGPFDAAAYAFDEREFTTCTLPHDKRPKQFVVMDKDEAEELSGFPRKQR